MNDGSISAKTEEHRQEEKPIDAQLVPRVRVPSPEQFYAQQANRAKFVKDCEEIQAGEENK